MLLCSCLAVLFVYVLAHCCVVSCVFRVVGCQGVAKEFLCVCGFYFSLYSMFCSFLFCFTLVGRELLICSC